MLNSEKVEYLLVGGYAVGYYGYPRATGDMDLWIAVGAANAEAVARSLRQFGFRADTIKAAAFLAADKVFRIGLPPMRIDLVTSIDGVDFGECYSRRVVTKLDDVEVSLIGLDDLKTNKRAVGRAKDIDDLEHL